MKRGAYLLNTARGDTARPGTPERKAAGRYQARVRENLYLLPKNAQQAILDSLKGTHQYPVDEGDGGRAGDEAPTASIPKQPGY